MTGSTAPALAAEVTDPRTPSRALAAQTRAATEPTVRLLTPPSARTGALLALAADSRFSDAGNLRKLRGYDMGVPPDPVPLGAVGSDLQRLGIDAAATAMLTRVRQHWVQHDKLRPQIDMLLGFLAGFDGDTWQDRWLASGADSAPEGLREAVSGGSGRAVSAAVNAALVVGLFRPSYGWLLEMSGGSCLPKKVLGYRCPDATMRFRALPAYVKAAPRHQLAAERCVSRVMIRTGRDLLDLRGEDLLTYADVVRTSGHQREQHLAWELMVALGPFADEATTLRAAWSAKGNTRQHTTATLVDRYGIPRSGVRDLLVDYLTELRPGMDYGSLQSLAYRLVRLFWWQVLQINPDQQNLHLAPDVATRWREALDVTTDGRPRREVHSTLFGIRAMYRDLAEWSHEEPGRWGPWVAPCPVAKAESRGASVAKRRQRSTMQARTRALTPLLPALVAEAQRRRAWSARVLAAAQGTVDQQVFRVDGAEFVRTNRPTSVREAVNTCVWVRQTVVDPAAPALPPWNGRINLTRAEEDGFWGWAIIETLRHTGIRLEEMYELTQLSLRHYTSARTGTVVPLLHIVPSKNDTERLIPMSPELVAVLLEVLRRGKGADGRVPMSVRYDSNEKLHGDPMPHLFARPVGARYEVISTVVVRRLLNEVADGAGLTDAGAPIHFTPHDFRRLFSTDIVGAGLPLHIAATLLGHLSLETTRGYTAVFPDQVLTAHQHFIERRRTKRPVGELRQATDAEWTEFEDHFLLRKVALGDCHRPYGTPCVHEHACTRCPFLVVDPAQLGRVEDMTTNAQARLVEARQRNWLGEVSALEQSLEHLHRRRDEMASKLKQSF